MKPGLLLAFERGALSRPAVFFLAYAAWLGVERFILGPYSYLEMHDIGDSMIPRTMMAVRELLAHGPSYWLASGLCGVDRLAQTHTYLSPSALFFLVFPGWAAFALALMTGLFLSTYFTFRVCRDDLGLPPELCLYAGVANAWVYNNELLITQWGFAAFPLAVWSLNRLHAGPKRGLLRAALLGLAYSWASVFATSIPFCLLGLFAWFTLVQPRALGRFWLEFFVFCGATLVLQVQTVWALLANLPQSQRAQASLELPAGLSALPGVLWASLLDLMRYHLSAFLAAAGCAASRLRDRRLASVCALFALAVAGSPLLNYSAAFLPASLSVFKGYNFSRFSQLGFFLGACSGALGLKALAARYGDRTRLLAPVCVVLMILASVPGKFAGWRSWLFEGTYAANYDSRTLRDAFPPAGRDPYRVVSILHGIYPLYSSVYGLESADGEANIYPRRYNRFWAKVIEPAASLRPALAAQVQSFTDVGTRVQLPLDAVEHDPAGLTFNRYYRLNLLSLTNTRYIISRHPLIDGRLKALKVQEPWRAFSARQRLLLRLRENFFGKSYFYFYENTTALPRFFVAKRVRFFKDDVELWRRLTEAAPSELRETALLMEEHASEARIAQPHAQADVTVRSDSPDRIELALRSDGAGLLVAANNFTPFWTCTVDGVPRRIVPAYETFWGVAVGKDDKTIVFEYDPPYRLRNMIGRLGVLLGVKPAT